MLDKGELVRDSNLQDINLEDHKTIFSQLKEKNLKQETHKFLNKKIHRKLKTINKKNRIYTNTFPKNNQIYIHIRILQKELMILKVIR